MMIGCRAGRKEVRTAAMTAQYMAVGWGVLTRAGIRAGCMSKPAAVKLAG